MVKTITIRDEVYRRLAAIKRSNESFSDLFERLAEGQGSLAELVSLRGAISFERDQDRESFIELATGRRSEKRQ